MSRRFRLHKEDGSFNMSAGWLFADLLLALAMLFLAANTLAIKPPPTPPKNPVHKTSTPTPLPRLELQPHHIQIQVDANGLRSNSKSAINSVKQQIQSKSFLKGRVVGLVIGSDGAPNDSQIPNAQSVVKKMYSILGSLGTRPVDFSRASYYNPLYFLGEDSSIVTLDIYLFAR